MAERKRLIRDVEKAGLRKDGTRWLSRVRRQVLAALADGREASSSELKREIAALQGSIVYGEGKSWGGPVAVAPRVLGIMSAAGQVVRASNAGGWTASRPLWTSAKSWLGEEIEPMSEREGLAKLVGLWLRAFGPGTEADVKWWLGSTVRAARQALADLEAVEVDLEGRTGYLLPDDLEPVEPVEPWAALLPALDPTTMGWTERDWYLGPHKAQLFDTAGNAGPSIWWDGRIVGGWLQAENGEVVLRMLEDVGAEATRAVEREAERLGEWLGSARVLPRFPTPLVGGPAPSRYRTTRYFRWVTPGASTARTCSSERPGPTPSNSRAPPPSISGTMCSSSSSTSPAARYWLMASAPPPIVTSLPAAASVACSRADSIPSVTKVNVVSESVSGSRSWWVSTNTGTWNGGSSPHHPVPGIVAPRPGPAAELAAAHDLGADVRERLLDDRVARVHLSALLAVGLAPRLQRDHPVVQALAALAERVLLALVRSGDVAVRRDRDVDR